MSAAIETQCKSQTSETQGALQRVTPGLRPAARCIRGEMAKEIVIKSIGSYMFLFSLIMNPKSKKIIENPMKNSIFKQKSSPTTMLICIYLNCRGHGELIHIHMEAQHRHRTRAPRFRFPLGVYFRWIPVRSLGPANEDSSTVIGFACARGPRSRVCP